MHIDTLLQNNDYVKAWKEINDISPDRLNDGDHALYCLLFTQAQYKNYKSITSDSIISQAVEYYQKSNNKEKATRSVLYQGCVYEVLGEPEKAIDCYKKADETADEQDMANKAYAKLRSGILYQDNIVGAKEIAVEKYIEALRLYRLLSNKHYELLCLTNIGAIYRDFKEKEKQDSALYYIDSAIALAWKNHDRYFLFENLFTKAEYYELVKHQYLTAKHYAIQAIELGGNEIDHPRAHYCAAKSYIKLGHIDSAYYYLSNAPKLNTARDSIMYCNLLADIAQYNNQKEDWLLNKNKAISMADSILIGNLNAKLFTIEKKYDIQQEELKNVSLRSKLRGAWLTITLTLLGGLALFHFLWRYRNKLRAKENEYELLKSDLDASMSSLEQMQATINNHEEKLRETETRYRAKAAQQQSLVTDLTGEIASFKSSLEQKEQERLELAREIADLEAKKTQSEEIRSVIASQINVMHELIRSSHELDNEKFGKKFVSLMSVPDSPRTATYWSNLQVLTNDLHNNILEDANRLAKGKLLESDINFIALLCCGYSRTAIMICMKFRNIVTISNKKKKIAKKMGIPSLDEFIRPYLEDNKKSD